MKVIYGSLLSIFLLAGCGNSMAFLPSQGVLTTPLSNEAKAFAGADGATSDSILNVSLDLGKMIPVPYYISYYKYEVGTDAGYNLAVDWFKYDEPVGNSGCRSIDEFSAKATGFSAGATIIGLPYSGADPLYGMRGDYTLGFLGGYLNVDLELYSFFQSALEWRDLVATVTYDYYINDSFSVGFDYSYKYYFNLYSLNFKYLFSVPQPLFLNVSLRQFDFDGSSGTHAFNSVIGLDWVFIDNWFASLNVSRRIFNGDWADYDQGLNFMVGYRIKDNISAAIGINSVRTSWLSDPETSFTMNFTQRF